MERVLGLVTLVSVINLLGLVTCKLVGDVHAKCKHGTLHGRHGQFASNLPPWKTQCEPVINPSFVRGYVFVSNRILYPSAEFRDRNLFGLLTPILPAQDSRLLDAHFGGS